MTPQERQQLKVRFFGMHIGAQVDFSSKFKSENYGVDAKAERCLVKDSDMGYTWWPLHHCKLILRPLSSITDQEAIECANIYDPDIDWGVYKRNQYFVQVIDKKSGEIFTIWFADDDSSVITLIDAADNTCAFNQFTCIDWLRSRNFALPFCDLSPVREGWAILEETNQPQGATISK